MRLRALLVVMMFGLGAQAVSALQASGSDVPMFRGDPARTGVMPGPGPDPANGIAERWRFAISDLILVHSSPAVVGGTVYVGDDVLYAIDAASGAERWRFATGSSTFSSPTVMDGTIYVGSGDGLYAVDAATGGSAGASRASTASSGPRRWSMGSSMSGMPAARRTRGTPETFTRSMRRAGRSAGVSGP